MPNDPAPPAKTIDLLDLLVCPKCKGALSHRENPAAFVCPTCRLAYGIVDDIPNFIEEDATPV